MSGMQKLTDKYVLSEWMTLTGKELGVLGVFLH